MRRTGSLFRTALAAPAVPLVRRSCPLRRVAALGGADAVLGQGPLLHAAPSTTRRWCSGDFDLPEQDPIDLLLEEVDMLTEQPIPIGTLFKTLSPDSRKFLGRERMPLETFLLRHSQRFSVFKPPRSNIIHVSRFGEAPEGVSHGTESTSAKMFDGSKREEAPPREPRHKRGGKGGKGSKGGGPREVSREDLYTVLRYIPNEWSAYVLLPIPDEVKKDIIRKPAKRFFESQPRYFEVAQQEAHTFAVRRSMELQEQQRAAQEQDSE